MASEQQSRESEDFHGPQAQPNLLSTPRWLNKNTIMKCIFITTAIICLLSCMYKGSEAFVVNNFYDVTETPRAKLQQPRIKEHELIVWKIGRSEGNNDQSKGCSLINAVNIVTKNTVDTITQLLHHKQFNYIFLVTDTHDVKSRSLIYQSFKGREIQRMQVQIDADLAFVSSIKQNCSKLAYLFGNFKINEQMSFDIAAQMNRLQPQSIYYTSSFQKGNAIVNTPDFSTVDLSQLDSSSFYTTLYIFDTQSLNVLAPINFVYYAKYTLEELILVPTLVYYQSAEKMNTNQKILHSLQGIVIQFKQFTLKSLGKQDNSHCLISYPSDPYKLSQQQAIQYLTSIQKQIFRGVHLTIVVYLPYKVNLTQGISKVANKMNEIGRAFSLVRVKLKVMKDKISPSHAVYESVYSFCPAHTLVISSRHNVRFHERMTKQLLNWISTRYHYYYFNYEDQNGKNYDLNSSLNYDFEFIAKKGTIFQQRLRHIQVFKGDLMKMVPFWILKSAEVDFYLTEAPFVFNMIQMLRNIKIQIIQQALATVNARNMSSTEAAQVENVKLFTVYTRLIFNLLMPYPFNSLENPVYRKNAPMKIPPNLHQIWLSRKQISEVRMALHETMIQANPNFKMYLWKKQNLTKENFPITYSLINTIFEKNKQSKKVIYAMAADLMRYEIVLQHGGIYVDFKWQGNRPLDNFRKYECFFIDFDNEYIRFGRPKAMGNGFMGSIPNNYHLKAVLNQLMTEHTLTFGNLIPFITGGWVVRNAFTDFEIFTQIGLGYHLFVPVAYERAEDYCGGVNKQSYDSDQKVYEIQYGGKRMKFEIPCKRYPDSYGVMVSPLLGTWLRENPDIN